MAPALALSSLSPLVSARLSSQHPPMTERDAVAIKLQRLIAAHKAFKRLRRDYPPVGREWLTAAIIAEIDRNLEEILAEIRRVNERLGQMHGDDSSPKSAARMLQFDLCGNHPLGQAQARLSTKVLPDAPLPNHRGQLRSNMLRAPMRFLMLACSLPFIGAGEVVAAENNSPQFRALHAEYFNNCMKDWEVTTHMTKDEWSRTCRRLADERVKFRLEHGKDSKPNGG